MPDFSLTPPARAAKLLREGPSDRAYHAGIETLSTPELLALVLSRGGTTPAVLADATQVFAANDSSLRAMAKRTTRALVAAHPQLTQQRADAIAAAFELGRRLAAEVEDERQPIRSPKEVYQWFAPKLAHLEVEEFHVALLDVQHRLQKSVLVTRGILHATVIHPREVFALAIAEHAAAIILVHNHPSGDPTPSSEDRQITEQMVAAGRLLDLPVHDHVIVGKGRYTSFAEAGLL